MGLLSLFSGGGLGGLTKGLGSQGGLLSMMGMGAHGTDPGAGQGFHLGSPGGLIDLINRPGGLTAAMKDGSLGQLFHGLGGQGGQGDQQQPMQPMQPPNFNQSQQPGIAALIQQYLQSQQMK
jgi:hypothetical protein